MKNQTIYIIVGLVVSFLILWFIMRKKITGLTYPFKLRGVDKFGSGAFKAPRRSHKGKIKWHQGLDIKVKESQSIHAPFDMDFVRKAYPYDDSGTPNRMSGAKYRFEDGTMKIFYFLPLITNTINFKKGDIIGFAQNIAKKYAYKDKKTGKVHKMINHIHIEIRNKDGKLINPETYV